MASLKELSARLTALEERVGRLETRRPPPGDGRTTSTKVSKSGPRCVGCGLPLKRRKGRCAECGLPL